MSSNAKAPWSISTKGLSSASAYKAFDGNSLTFLNVAPNQDIDVSYLRLNKIVDGVGAPWHVYGFDIICSSSDNYNNLPRSIKVYGTFDRIDDAVEIANADLSSVTPIITGKSYKYRVYLNTPAQYPSYIFSMFVLEDDGAVFLLDNIYFLRPKADILAEGGTV